MSLRENLESTQHEVEMNTKDHSSYIDEEGYDYEEFEFSTDPKIQELQSCKAIYSQLDVDYKNRTGNLNVPIDCDEGIQILLSHLDNGENQDPQLAISCKRLEHLPPINIRFEIPETYPDVMPPTITLHSLFMPSSFMERLRVDVLEITATRRDFILFDIINHVEETVQNLRTLTGDAIIVEDQTVFDRLVAHDLMERRKQFENTTFLCQICQQDYKGRCCFRFECEHIFCNACLNDYFAKSIRSGEVEKVHCPSYECTREMSLASRALLATNVWLLDSDETKSLVDTVLTPPLSLLTLSQILKLGSESERDALVERYVSLFKKSRYQVLRTLLPNRLVDCPRYKCEEVIFRGDVDDRLVRCLKCGYAFCNDCHRSWHARFVECKKIFYTGGAYEDVPIEVLEQYIEADADLTVRRKAQSRYGRAVMARVKEQYEMDKLFSQMISDEDGFTLCPRCNAGIEKTDGCNKVVCLQCTTVFCFLCGEIMENNYDHYADYRSPCYRKLFVGMVGAS